MENSYRFFANKACRFYPCHKGIEELNCLFCFCPLYFLEHCPGSPEWIEVPSGKGKQACKEAGNEAEPCEQASEADERDKEVCTRRIKDCSGCTFPHKPENYDVIMKKLREATGLGR